MTPNQKEEMRREFKERFKIKVTPNHETDTPKAILLEKYGNNVFLEEIADFWLSKLESHLEGIRKEVEGMRLINNKCDCPYPPCLLECEYNSAIEKVLSILTK